MINKRLWTRIGELVLVFLTCVSFCNMTIATAHTDVKSKYVLYISSYSFAWESVALQIAGVQDALSDSCIINYEFMDTKNVKYSEDYHEFYDMLKFKLQQRPHYDGIIVADDAALKFAQRYKEELFPFTPIVFTGIDDIANGEKAAKEMNMRGVLERVDYKRNVEAAEYLIPDADRIIFIYDSRENGQGIAKQLAQYGDFFQDKNVEYLNSSDYTKEELIEKLQEFTMKDIVFINSLGQGKNGEIYSEDERMDILRVSLHAPAFRVSSKNFPDVFIGGVVVDHQESAMLAAHMLSQLMQGISPSALGVIEDTPYLRCFNQKRMLELGVSMNRLPQYSTIVYPVPTFLDRNYEMIISTGAFLLTLLLLLLIVGTFHNLALSKAKNRVITDQKIQLEKALMAKSSFLSRMSHEIRTPLNSILGCAHLAKYQLEKQQNPEINISRIMMAGQFLLNLISDILDVSRIEAEKIKLNLEWHDPQELLNSVIEMMDPIMAEKQINFVHPEVKELGLEQLEWYVDIKRLQQIIINILNNAAKFTPVGGRVELIIKKVSIDKEYYTNQICIKDNGCGMSPAFVAHIGEAFTQEQNQYSDKVAGSGLGLFIVKKLIELMGGHWRVTSQEGQGSQFDIQLKYKYRKLSKAEVKEKTQQEEVDLSGMRILCAEDNAMNQLIMEQLLGNKKVQVTLANNGQEAVDIFAKSQVGDYDVILMDIRMPVMNGIEATKRIRRMNRVDAQSIPIIALSADAIPEEIQNAKECGLTEYLTKPVNPGLLYENLEKVFLRSSKGKKD